MNLFNKLKEANAGWKEKEISKLLNNGETVLDYGCGDLMFASRLKAKNKTLKITGVDVVNVSGVNGIKFIKYDGKKLPFKNNSFDTVVSVFVFHHCEDALLSFKECLRVAKKRVIFIETTAQFKPEILPMKFMDWLYNVWKPEPIPLTFQFKTLDIWKKFFHKIDVKTFRLKQINNPMSFLPIGKAYLFEIKK